MKKIHVRKVETLKTTAAAAYPICECILCGPGGPILA